MRISGSLFRMHTLYNAPLLSRAMHCFPSVMRKMSSTVFLLTDAQGYSPNNTTLLSNHAATLLALLRPREAIQDCEKALAVDPNFLRAYQRMSRAQLMLGNIDEARKLISVCLERDPSNGTFKEDVSYLYLSLLSMYSLIISFLISHPFSFLQRNQIDFVEKTQQQIAEAMKNKAYSEALMLITRVIECVFFYFMPISFHLTSSRGTRPSRSSCAWSRLRSSCS